MYCGDTGDWVMRGCELDDWTHLRRVLLICLFVAGFDLHFLADSWDGRLNDGFGDDWWVFHALNRFFLEVSFPSSVFWLVGCAEGVYLPGAQLI